MTLVQPTSIARPARPSAQSPVAPLVQWGQVWWVEGFFILASVQAHDAQVASSGITTVFDAIRIGIDDAQSDMTHDDMQTLGDAIRLGVSDGRLRADHLIHLRCEVSAPDCLASFEQVREDPHVRFVSLMDHSPGQRQFATEEAYRSYYQGKLKMTDAELEAFSARRLSFTPSPVQNAR